MMISSRGEFSGDAPAISVDHLRVIRGKRPVLQDLSVQIAPGTITGLLGPSGCGKTTLIRCIVGTQRIIGVRVGHVLGQPGRLARSCAAGSAT